MRTISEDAINEILLADAKHYGVKPQKFISDNEFQYCVFTRSYLNIIKDVIDCDVMLDNIEHVLLHIMRTKGLYGLSVLCGEAWDAILANQFRMFDFPDIYGVIVACCELEFPSNIRAVTSILKYPKRFTPVGILVGEDECIERFHQNNIRMRSLTAQLMRNEHNTDHILYRMRSHIYSILESYRDVICSSYKSAFDWTQPMDALNIPDGADYEGHGTILEKFIDISRHIPNPYQVSTSRVFLTPDNGCVITYGVTCQCGDAVLKYDGNFDEIDRLLSDLVTGECVTVKLMRTGEMWSEVVRSIAIPICVGIYGGPNLQDIEVLHNTLDLWYDYATMKNKKGTPLNKAKFCAVPKSATKSRGICMEECYRSVLAGTVSTYLHDACRVTGSIDLENADLNRLACIDACRTGMLSTWDLSDASDSLSSGLIHLIFPTWLLEIMDSIRSNVYEANGCMHNLDVYLTMGSRLTMPIQSLTYWSFLMSLVDIYNDITGDNVPYNIYVYGDDMIAPTEIDDMVLHYAPYLGLRINETKSFTGQTSPITLLGNARYRESCGTEAYLVQSKLYVLTDAATLNVCTVASSLQQVYYPRKAITCDIPGYFQAIELQHSLFTHGYRYAAMTLAAFLAAHRDMCGISQTITFSDGMLHYDDLWMEIPQHTLRPMSYDEDRAGMQCPYSAPVHSRVLPVYPKGAWKALDAYQREMLDILLYEQFLRQGPSYADGLMELLGCSRKVDKASLALKPDGYKIGYIG